MYPRIRPFLCGPGMVPLSPRVCKNFVSFCRGTVYVARRKNENHRLCPPKVLLNGATYPGITEKCKFML